jgi:hypothetical protein
VLGGAFLIRVRNKQSGAKRSYLTVSAGALYHVALFQTDVSKTVLCPSSGVMGRWETVRSSKRQFEIVLHLQSPRRHL